MNRKAIIGTLVWGLILFLVISAFIFYVSFKQAREPKEEKPSLQPEEITVQEAKISLALVNKALIQELKIV